MGEDRHLVTDGIILKTTISSEINKNFTFLSPTIGIQNVIAFGAAKTKSRFCSSVQSFVKAKFFLYKAPKTEFYKLEDISEVTTNDFIRSTLENIYLTSFFSEVLLDSFISIDESRNFYYLLLYTLEIIAEQSDVKKAFLFFVSKFLFLSGYNPNLTSCKKCKKESDLYYFDNVEGGVLCDAHALNTKYSISRSSVEIFKDFLEKKYFELKNKEINSSAFNQIFSILIFLIKNIFEKDLKTIPFLEEFIMGQKL